MFWHPDIHPDQGPFRVELKRGEFFDESRDRAIPFKIYYPTGHGLSKVPIIFWSHGFGGNRDGASFLSRYITAHGYIMVHITHTGTDSSLWEGKDGHPWDILTKTEVSRETTLDRFMDVPFALDAVQRWASENKVDGQVMDFDAIGMSGHSFGAMTTQVMAGMKFPGLDDKAMSMADPRFKAGILYSPITVHHLMKDEADQNAAYQSMNIPLLHMTGTDDASPVSGRTYEHRLAVYEESGSPEKYLLVKKDGDHMVYNGTRGKLATNPKRELHENIIKIGSLAFWDAYLKDDERAKEWLKNDFEHWLKGEGEFQSHA